jgi:hypothetical protein
MKGVHTMKKKTNSAYKKMTAEQLQGLMHLRKRGFAEKNGAITWIGLAA